MHNNQHWSLHFCSLMLNTYLQSTKYLIFTGIQEYYCKGLKNDVKYRVFILTRK